MDAAQDGLIVKEQSGFYWVDAADGETYMCELRGKLKEAARASDIAAIGDRVSITLRREEGTDALMGLIQAVAPRKSALSRALRTTGKRGAGQAEREDVIIANADRAIFVLSAAQPPPNFKMLDRLLVAGEKSDIADLLIVVNKLDLRDESDILAEFSAYRAMGYSLLLTSALRGDGIAQLRSVLDTRHLSLHRSVRRGQNQLAQSNSAGLGTAREIGGSRVRSRCAYHA